MKFPSPYGVSFILTYNNPYLSEEFLIEVSVSLRSIIHSYIQVLPHLLLYHLQRFPSPYGVSFILTVKTFKFKSIFKHVFPSPYGVSFILTLLES